MPNETTSKSSDTPIKPTDAKSASTADPKKQDAPVKLRTLKQLLPPPQKAGHTC